MRREGRRWERWGEERGGETKDEGRGGMGFSGGVSGGVNGEGGVRGCVVVGRGTYSRESRDTLEHCAETGLVAVTSKIKDADDPVIAHTTVTRNQSEWTDFKIFREALQDHVAMALFF